MKRTLHLRRETLGSLSDADLNAVVGGAFTREGGGLTCGGLRNCVGTAPTYDCVVTLPDCATHSLPTCRCYTTPNC